MIGILSLIGFRLYENSRSTGELYALITYKNTNIFMIDLNTDEYVIYDTIYKNDIDVGRASEGIYYVPGEVTLDMSALYEVDDYAKNHQIVGIKLQVKDQKISVVYQESPKDLCQLQAPTDSPLTPIVCLPNELVINVYSNLTSDSFGPDVIME